MSRRLASIMLLTTVLILPGCASESDRARTKKEDSIVQWTRVRSIYDANSTDLKRIIRFDRPTVVVTVSIDDAIAYMENLPQEHRRPEEVAGLRDKCRGPRTYRMDEFSVAERISLIYAIKHVLMQGKFLIEVKTTHEMIREIVVGTFWEELGTMAVSQTTKFYLPDGELFYLTLDMMS